MSEVKRWKLKGFLPGVEGECKAVFKPVVVLEEDYDAAQSQLAALREELAIFIKAQLGVSIAEPGETFIQTTLRLYRVSKARAKEFGIPEGENLDDDIQAFESYEALQQRLADAERRNDELEKNSARYIWLRDKSESVHQFYLSTPIWFTGVKFNQESVDSAIDAALNPNPEAASHDE